VKEISQVCVGGLELQQHKTKVQALSEETSQALKKNVYKNYMQFIETAREISHLEGEMYQLSHLLGDQRALLASMANSPQATQNPDTSKKEDFEAKRIARLSAITEKVDSCISLLDVPGRDLIHEGDLVELDPLENTALHRCHAFLLSDVFIITTWISNRRGPVKYKYEASYDVSTLAVVNVRDLGSIKYAFKLLVFPDTRLFQCANNQAKVDWLEKMDQVKKARVVEQGKREKPEQMSPVRTESIDSGSNPFGYVEENDNDDMAPEWVTESPEDLDVCIAQRHFEEAYSLIQKTNAYLEKAPQTSTNMDIKNKVEGRINSLIEVLFSELSVSAEKSLQGGLRASRRTVRLLNQLEKSNQACELYLKLCTSVLKAQMKRVKREGATVAYVRRLGNVFFTNLAAITTEFQLRAFPNFPSCSSAFVVWSSMEVSHFTTHLIKQIFMPKTSLHTLAESIDVIRKQCEQLCDLGLDMRYQLDGQLCSPVSRCLNETRDKLIEAVKVRCAEDTWHPSQHGKVALHKLQEEFTAAGLPSLQPYVTGDGWLELTSNTLSFTKLYCSLLDDGLTLCTPDLEHSLGKVLYDVFDAQLKHVAACLKIERQQPQKKIVQKNASFLIESLLKVCSQKYQDRMHHTSKKLEQLKSEYTPLLREITTTKISSITGYI
ncbi:hypothetical protein AAG570_012163, partial [Ranatra chinensis]